MLMRTPPENKSASFSSKGGKKKSDLYPAEALAKQFSAGDPEALAMLGSSPPSTSTGAVAVAEAAAAAAAAADAEKRRRKAAASGGAAAPAAGDEEGEEMDGATEESAPSPDAAAASEEPTTASAPTPRGAPPTAVSRFLPTTRRIVQFSAGAAAARPGDRVVYLDGAFDLFHPGHVAALKAARAVGDFLLVGVHSDEDVRARRGVGRPIMDLHERALSVLACRFVNEVVIGAPAVLTEDLLTTFNVAVVARGTTTETTPLALSPSPSCCSSSSPLDFAFSGGRRQLGNGGGGGGFSRGGGLPSMTSLSAPPSRAPSPSPVPSGVLEALGAPASPRGGGGGGDGDGDGDGDGKEGASSSAADAATAVDASAAAPSATEAAAVAAAASAEVAAAASFSSLSADASNGGGSNNNHGGSFFLSDERRYAVARAKGIFREFRSPSTLTAAAVVDRIVAHRAQFERRNAKKAAAEAAYYRESKTYVAEK